MVVPESTLSERFAGRHDLEAIARFLPGLGGPRFSERYPERTLIDFLDWKYFKNPLGDAVVAIATEPQIECAGTGLLELARFFEAAMTTLLHGRAPEPSELTLESMLPATGRVRQ